MGPCAICSINNIIYIIFIIIPILSKLVLCSASPIPKSTTLYLHFRGGCSNGIYNNNIIK